MVVLMNCFTKLRVIIKRPVHALPIMATNKTKKVLIVGLGNIAYPKTRHSVGMIYVDLLADQLGVRWQHDRSLRGYIAAKAFVNSNAEEEHLILLKSTFPMNDNGRSIAKAASGYCVTPSCIYLVHDELDKKLGRFSIKEHGSANGHNGVKSAINCLRTSEIPRLRIGIGRPSSDSDVVIFDYVLGDLTAEEHHMILSTFPAATTNLFEHIKNNACINLQVAVTGAITSITTSV